MATDTYNGWANRPTWLVVLHLNNEQHLQRGALDTAGRAYTDAVANLPGFMEDDSAERVDRYAVSMAADAMRDLVDELTTYDDTEPFTTDLVGTVLAGVDWYEVADAFLDDVDRVTEEVVDMLADDPDDPGGHVRTIPADDGPTNGRGGSLAARPIIDQEGNA